MNLRTVTLSVIGVVFALTTLNAQGRHPAYLRARTDLRRTQFLMRVQEEPNVTRYLKLADKDVADAILEIDRAALIDGKDLDDHPRIDANIDRKGRFHKIVDLLRSARGDLAREEDSRGGREWRNFAYKHIDQALENVHRAAVDLHWDHELGF